MAVYEKKLEKQQDQKNPMALTATSFANGCGIGGLQTELVDDEQQKTVKMMRIAPRAKVVADSHRSGTESPSRSRTGWSR